MPPPKINFDITVPELVDLEERMKFWDSMREWFGERGYHLYGHEYMKYTYPTLTFTGDVQLPYSHAGGDLPGDDRFRPPLADGLCEKVVFAQDSQARHVAIKLVHPSSDEYRTLRFLNEEKGAATAQCLIPVLDFLQYDGHWFVVMPKWGTSPTHPWFPTVRELLLFIHCILKALSFLHKNLIVHRDLKVPNMLVNHIARHTTPDRNLMRRKLRVQGDLTYALFDFDCSIIFPSTSTPAERRLLAPLSWEVCLDIPHDTAQGELDYDPFVFDVGCLGVLFCQYFQHCTPVAPMLAPLMDRMVTNKIEERFTASEALQFFEDMRSQLTPEQLDEYPPYPHPELTSRWEPEFYDRWAGLPEDFIRKWSAYRAPAATVGTRLLRRFCRFEYGNRAVQMVRRLMKFIGVL